MFASSCSRALAALVGSVLALCASCAAPSQGQKAISVVSYNLMTLFDAVDNGGEYAEFSVAKGKYDERRYKSRLSSLARVIKAAVPGGPDILAVQEIENSRVLMDLGRALGSYPYKACADDTATVLECGILSRYPIVSLRTHRYGVMPGSQAPRLLLEAQLDAGGQELWLLVAHWKSKLEGAEQTEPERVAAASLAASVIQEILAANPLAAVVLAGDLNENPDEQSSVSYTTALPNTLGMSMDRSVSIASLGTSRPILYSPWADCGGFSYIHDGTSERIDHLIVSPSLAGANDGPSLVRFGVAAPDFALDAQGQPIAYRSSTGTGFSDHLPLYAFIVQRP